jgi:hypothetical protein
VVVGLVGRVGVPAGPHHPEPGTHQDPDDLRVALAAPAGLAVQGGGPGEAWRLLSATVASALRARVLAAQRKWTEVALPDCLVALRHEAWGAGSVDSAVGKSFQNHLLVS